MNAIGQVLNNLVRMNSTNSASDHVCPHCNNIVPKLEIELLGQKRLVQPKCSCEVQEKERELQVLTKGMEKREIEKRFALSTLGARFKESVFDNFEHRLGSENAYKQAWKYAQEFKEWGGDSLIIWGEYGNGKSHLAAAVANYLNEQGYIVIFQSVPELLERIRNTFNRNNHETEREIMSALQRCELLVLDDIGAERVTDWVSDALFRIIDGRYRKQKPIMYTSNLKPSLLLERLGGRIHDRITETSLAIENKATSYRRQKAVERFKQYQEGV